MLIRLQVLKAPMKIHESVCVLFSDLFSPPDLLLAQVYSLVQEGRSVLASSWTYHSQDPKVLRPGRRKLHTKSDQPLCNVNPQSSTE